MFVRGVSLSTLREELHQKYGIFSFAFLLLPHIEHRRWSGDIIRISPNEVIWRISLASHWPLSCNSLPSSLIATLCKADSIR